MRNKRWCYRRQRRKKLGLPEELTEEEVEVERAAKEAEAQKEAEKRLPVKPVTKIAKMREILVQMKKASEGDEVRAVYGALACHTPRVCQGRACRWLYETCLP